MNETTAPDTGNALAGRAMSGLLSAMTNAEKEAAARFNETTEDGEGYDVKKTMMKRLAELGLVTHKGGGYYEQTDKMLELEDALRQHGR